MLLWLYAQARNDPSHPTMLDRVRIKKTMILQVNYPAESDMQATAIHLLVILKFKIDFKKAFHDAHNNTKPV